MFCSRPTSEDTKQRFFNCGSNINKNMLWVFISSYLYKNDRKESSTPQTSFLMLETNKDYSRVIVESSSTNCGWLRFMVKLCANSSYGIWGLRPCKNLRSNF